MSIPAEVRKWAARNGRKGGSKHTAAQVEACRANLAKARAKRWKPKRANS